MDEIQRKLALIDRQLAWSWASVHKQIIGTTPLLFAAAGLIAGIVIQNILHLPIWFWLIAIGIFIAATIISYRVKVKNLPLISAYVALMCFLCLGAIRLIHFHQPKPNDIRNLVGNERRLATIRGVIITEPYLQKNEQWKFVKFTFNDPTSMVGCAPHTESIFILRMYHRLFP